MLDSQNWDWRGKVKSCVLRSGEAWVTVPCSYVTKLSLPMSLTPLKAFRETRGARVAAPRTLACLSWRTRSKHETQSQQFRHTVTDTSLANPKHQLLAKERKGFCGCTEQLVTFLQRQLS
eukprot:1158278-Pelagomonas_calceolata.AAC.3